jgi:hypothetical protein
VKRIMKILISASFFAGELTIWRMMMATRSSMTSMGTVTAPVSFASGCDNGQMIMCHFNVLKKLAVPILMGEPFLRATETLSKYRDRLVQLSRHAIRSMCHRVFAIGNTQNEIIGIIDRKEMITLTGTRSEVSLMRRSYADQLGISYQSGTIELEFADGSIEQTSGFADLAISLGGSFKEQSRTIKTRIHIFR